MHDNCTVLLLIACHIKFKLGVIFCFMSASAMQVSSVLDVTVRPVTLKFIFIITKSNFAK